MAQPSRQQRKRGVIMYMAAAVIAAVWVISFFDRAWYRPPSVNWRNLQAYS